ncbi:MAG: ATP-binding protein [Bacteroidota bacterium]
MIFMLVVFKAAGQFYQSNIPFFTHYNHTDYNLHGSTYASVLSPWEDMMFAHDDGILVFTGHDWELIPIPERSDVRFLTVNENMLLAGGTNTAGYVDTDDKGMYRFVPLIDKYSHPVKVKEMACRDSVIFIRGEKHILMHHLKTGKTVQKEVNAESRFLKMNGQKYLMIKGEGLFKLTSEWFEKNNPSPVMKTEKLFFTMAVELNAALALVYEENEGFLLFDIINNTLEKWNNQMEGAPYFGKPFQAIKLKDEKNLLIAHSKGITVVSENGKAKHVFDKHNLLPENIVHDIYQDPRGNLWVNINDGMLYLEWSSPFRELNSQSGFEGYPLFATFSTDRLYTGTTSGLYKSVENPMENTSKKTFNKVNNTAPVHYHSTNKMLWVGSSDAVVQYPGGDTVLPFAAHTFAAANNHPKTLFAAAKQGLFRAKQENDAWSYFRVKGFRGTAQQMVVQAPGKIWVQREGGTIECLKLSADKDSVESVKLVSAFLPQAEEAEWNLHSGNDKLPVISGTKGYYRFNPQQNQFEGIAAMNSHLPKVKMDLIKQDQNGKYWFWRNNAPSMGGLAGKVMDAVVLDTMRFKRLMEYEIRDIDVIEGKTMFALNNKLVFYLPSRSKPHQPFEVFLSKIHDISHDSLILRNPFQNGRQSFTLRPFQNNLRFIAHTNLFTSTGRMQYSFFLENHDADWSHWQNNQFKDYTALKPGKYEIHIKALDFHGHISEIPPVSIHIKAPWYATAYAYGAYGLIALVLLFVIIEQNKKAHRRKTLRLEKLVKQRTQELVDQREAIRKEKDKISEMNKTKDKFFSIIAHDLRSPFNSLLGLSSILTDDFDNLTDGEKKDMAEHIHKTSNLSFNLLDNLLAWSRTQRDKVEIYPEKHDLSEVVKETIHLLYSSAEAKNIRINNLTSRSYEGYFDKNMVLTITRNLVSNAIKFTQEGGLIEINITEDKKQLRFMVKDNGIGMSDKELQSLFDLGNQMRRKGTKNEAGTGLGMILCKDFAERNNGRLLVESEFNKGSIFTLVLPKEAENTT